MPATRTPREVLFTFDGLEDDLGPFVGYTYGGTWNGWPEIYVKHDVALTLLGAFALSAARQSITDTDDDPRSSEKWVDAITESGVGELSALIMRHAECPSGSLIGLDGYTPTIVRRVAKRKKENAK